MLPSRATPWYKKLIIHAFLASFFSSLLPMNQVVEALSIVNKLEPSSTMNPGGGLAEIRSVGSTETRYGLVAILVEDGLWDSTVSTSGSFSFLGGDSLSEKIQTYAEDVQATLPWTKTVIVKVSSTDTPVDIQRMLERFYFEGNVEDSDPTKLSGVVIVGDVPLPVVNKNGNRFISLLPYTDFEEQSYVLDENTQDFLPNLEARNLQAEVWHGVIVPPLQGQDGVDLLAAYFDKNHKFHDGDEAYTTFDQKVFLGDLVTEEHTINPTAYASYQRYLALWEELTYYRFTNGLVEELFTEMQTSVGAGDSLDNDGDGDPDEEASNGIDDDSDGLVDEDIGDGFFGIDNDGDCSALSASQQDSNGDGKPCFGGIMNEDGEYDLEPDDLVDEDSFDDNNNDKGWVMDFYAERDGSENFEDQQVDEDPPGDTTGGEDADGDGIFDGDGCPGICGEDDNGDAIDHDMDGYPTGWEIMYGTDPFSEKQPWPAVANLVNDIYGTSYSADDAGNEEATAFLSDFFIDGFYTYTDDYRHPSCYSSSGAYHSEWDDDEDGFCDEDGSTEVQLWVDDEGTPGNGVCAYNDADCDALIDEDPLGLRPEGMFDDLPDIQAKSIVEGLISQYAELFDQPQGVWNRFIGQTGRYKTHSLNDEGNATNDYDTAISLIAKKDEAVLQFFKAFNDYFEARVNTMVEDTLAEEIPIIAGVRIIGDYTLGDDDDDDDAEPEDMCTVDTTDVDGACAQFVNQSGFNAALFDSDGNTTDLSQLEPWEFYINGQNLWEISSPKECTNYAGTDEEEGQLAQFNSLYSRDFATDEDHADMTKEEVREYRNCVPEFSSYTNDIPELCNTSTVIQPIRTLDGAKAPGPDVTAETKAKWETGPQACFEFRELKTFNLYTQTMAEFNNWLTTKLRQFGKEDSDDEAVYADFLAKVEEKRADYEPRPEDATLRKHFNEIDLIAADSSHSYTMEDLMKELGYSSYTDEDIDTFIAAQDDDDEVTIDYPQEGSGMDDVSELNVYFDKIYLTEEADSGALVDDMSDAKTITSVYKSVEPTNATLNAQIKNAASPNLPIDKTRRIKFIDADGAAQEVTYMNVFSAVTVEDVEEAVSTLKDDINDVAGGSVFQSDVEGFLDEINVDQLRDALAWRALSIDEKHKYVFTHYLGMEEAISSKVRNGYEMVSMITDGDATNLYFAFNGDKPETEGDLEFMYRSQELIDAALAEADSEEEPVYEPISEVSNTTPILIFDWIEAMQEWLQETENSLTSVDTYEEDTVCGDKVVYDSGANDDADADGIPDDAAATTTLSLTSDDNEVLLANNGDEHDYYTVSVSAEKSDGSINTDDNYTEVTLEVTSGADSISVSYDTLQLTGGVAIFNLLSGSVGDFTIQAVSANRDDLGDSNSLSGSVVSKKVFVTTYELDEQGSSEATTVEQTDRIEVTDGDGNIVAILDPDTGDLELRNATRAELREATDSLPTRVAIMSEAGETYGVFFIIPDEKAVSIGDGASGVFVVAVGTTASAATAEEGVALELDGVQIGLVSALGQIAISDAYSLDFDNSESINLYDPIHVLDGGGETLFTVTIKHSFVTGEIVAPEDEDSDYLSANVEWPVGRRAPIMIMEEEKSWGRIASASAATVIADTDSDLLDDLEEWTIGTELDNDDSDGDSYIDGLEIFSGYDPLVSGKKLFTDISSDNVAYQDLAVLYLRGIVQGYSDGSFRPDNKITREEFIKIDLGAICKDCDSYSAAYEATLLAEYGQDPFPDTDINPDLLACVAEGKVDGIVSGYAGGDQVGYYLPTQYISRAEGTKVLVETGGFDVAEVSADEVWYSEYVNTAKENGLFPEGVDVTTAWLEGSMTRAEFVMMAVNLVNAKDCRAVDTDGEGLSDVSEEVLYSTDPLMADTDLGGVNDFDEVIRDSDPLDASDDFPGSETEVTEGTDSTDTTSTDTTSTDTTDEEDFVGLSAYEHAPGLYAVSSDANYEQISSSTGAGATEVPVFTNDIAADGESILYVRAEIRDQDDKIYVEDDTSVIEFILSSSENGELSSDLVQVENGLAETTFNTSEIAGDLTVEGHITDNSLPSQNAEVHVYPGEPVRLELAGESTVLPAGAEAVSDMTVYLYDSFGNLAYNGFYSVTLSTEGGLTLLDLSDEDTEAEGTQVTTSDGYLNFRVLASPDADTSTVQASLLSVADSGDTFTITHKESMTLKVAQSSPYLLAGGSSSETVTVSVVDGNGAYVTGFQGDVQLSLSDASYGTFTSSSVTLVSGQASASLTPGTLAGTGSIIAESTGIEGGSSSLDSKPADIYELRIEKDDGTTVLSAGERAKLIVSGYDQYGNLVTTDSTSVGSLRLTTSTEDFGTLSSGNFTLNQGKASFYITPGEVSGKINVVAAATGLLAGTWGGDINYTLSGEEFADIDPQMLYGSFLGGPFGDTSQEDYIAGWLTFNGKTQAVTSLVSEPKPKKRLATIDASGAITLPEDSMVTQTVESAGSELPTRIQWREFPDDNLIGEIFYVMPSEAGMISAELLNSDDDFVLEEGETGDILLRENSAATLKIREDGQIAILDPAYSLVINAAAEGLGFAVLKGTEQVLRIDFNNSAWDGDITQVDTDFNLEDWDTLASGIYIKPTAVTENRLVTIPTGNSSLNPMGIAIIDPNEDLDKSMQPSLGYMSLESAEDDGSVGWENENKHLLLFAAGNTVGESNLFYPSEVGIVLGDPTIKLPTANEVNDMGFTSDIGTMVAASSNDIVSMMDLDYNGDGMMDVLTAYEDGSINVLQNAKAPVRLQDRGELLFIENGISSIDKGDFNNDGLEDLMIVTDEACYAGEVCIYEYENIGGGFIATNLDLTALSGKPTQVEVYDLNGDDYDDLVIADENMVLYTVWNSGGTLETVDEIKNFGLNSDSTQNLNGDLAVRYDGLEDGPISLPILTTEQSSSNEDFITALGIDSDFTLKVDGQDDTGTVGRNENLSFDYGDSDELAELFSVTKSVADSNGEVVEVGDSLAYTITMENVSGSTYSDIYLSDSIGTYFTFESESFTCIACSAANSSVTLQGGDSTRPFVYGPLSLGVGESLSFSYSGTVTLLPNLSVMVGQDIYSDYKDDNYADIAISPDGNTSGALELFYSDGYITETDGGGFLGLGATSYRRISYQEKQYSPATDEAAYDTTVENPFGDADGDFMPDFIQDMDPEKGIPAAAEGDFDPISELLGGVDIGGAEEPGEDPIPDGYYSADEMYESTDDADGDGLVDLVDQWVTGTAVLLDSSLDLSLEAALSGDDLDLEAGISVLEDEVAGATQVIEDVVSALTCSGGCLAFPGSIAFLARGSYHIPVLGTTITPADPGFPVFGILPYLPVVCTLSLCYGSNVMRIYLSPTTTLALGVSLCLGPYQGGVAQCFSISIPLLPASVCDAINGFLADSLSKASAFVSEGTTAAFNVSTPGGGSLSVGASAGGAAPTGLSSDVFEDYEPPVSANANVQVPGFPGIFTEWWKAQKEEFFKMLDLPDITFIYPDPNSITTEFTGIGKKASEDQSGDAVKLDTESKIKVLNSAVMGLEKWLNMANALPLIDIKPEHVQVRYPAITKEEIEIVTEDWKKWVEDTKDEWDRFKEQFDLRDDVTAAEQETFDELQGLIDTLITAVETNMAILESYTEIPETILMLRDIQAYYAKSIICYLDAVLSHTAGYLSENVQRIQAWAQFVVDLKKIVSGWQILIDLSADLMDSCDKCTNQRYSGMQLIFSLFVFMPEFPVIEMPKLPDIVIDVSNIQAGIDIIWPDIEFVPERINIPELPRIILPSAKLTGELNLDLNIPTLPEFKIDFEIPELPGLSIPDLPSLPPPPALPELDPTISAALKIAGSVLKIVCIIRQGFMPTSESNLKTKIEEITERSGGIVLPFDLSATVEWPSFSFDFVKKIQINTYLNLTTDFNVIFDVVKDFADETNEFTTDFVQEGLNKPMQEVTDAIQKAMNLLDIEVEADVEVDAEADLESGEVGAEGSADVEVEGEEAGLDEGAGVDAEADTDSSSYIDAMNTALAYKDEPLVRENLGALTEIMQKLQSDLTAWDDDMPETITLTATQRILSMDDPLLNRYDDIIKGSLDLDKAFLASIENTPLASVAVLRDSMISYVEDFDQGTKALKGMDSDSFQRYLAQENLHAQYLLASDDGTPDDYSTAENWHPEELVTQDENEQALELASDSSSAYDGLSLGAAPAAFNTGLYLYDSAAGTSTRLTDYAAEAEEKTNIIFIDLDEDGDDDIVYSMGGDVYIKENYTESPSFRYVSSDPSEMTVAEVEATHGSVQNFKRGKNDFEEASFSFSESPEAVGYEVLFYDSLDAQDAEPEENIKRLLLLANEENDSVTFTDTAALEYTSGSTLPVTEESATYQANSETSIVVPGASEFELPKVLESRLHAENVSGNVKLLNAPQRTLISETGELETDDGVTFQTVEKTTIEIDVNDFTTRIELPAYTLITFGHQTGRVIRVDSGSVYWMQEIVEEQDLEEGMEIFPEEMVSLESSGADATMITSEGGEIVLNKQEEFIMDRLVNTSSPSANIEIENGAYYTVNRGLYSDGTWGTLSDNVLLNPQVCADSAEPYPLVDTNGADTDGDGAVEVAIFSTLELSAEGSFDSDSEIVDAYWDLDANVDADGDGIFNNDEESIGLIAEIGPYEDTDPRTVTLYITDATGNIGTSTISVEVYVPDIQITDATVAAVTGTTDPKSPEFPFHLVRNRSGVVKEIGTGYSTDENGDFTEEMISSELISVYDADGNVIAEFNPDTKQVLVYDTAYTVEAVPSETDWPSRLVVYENSTGIVMGSFIFVADTDSSILKVDEALETYNLSLAHQVTVYPVTDEASYEWTDSTLVARDDYGNLDFMLSQSGSITIFDNRYTLVKREADSLEDYLILEIYDGETLELEIWPGTAGTASIVTTKDLDLSSSSLISETHESLSADTHIYFEDLSTDDALYTDIANLVERGILEGYDVGGKRYFYPDQAINRAEFTKIILSILCIVPREEAYVLPATFTDILDAALWYFPYTKEAFLLDLITGYLGEVNSAGISPFKPDNTITRAEATKIVLEALNEEEIITLPDNLTGVPWYAPYLEIAQDLTPYMNADVTAGTSNFILTADEAADPSHEMTRYEFVEMSVRVLQAYNCFDLDSDGDGLVNYDEESIYGTDPYNPDTDAGGVDDGTEVGRSTDPLDSTDDFGEGTLEGATPGVYAVTEVCSACPCTSSMDYNADLKLGDEVFAIIENDEGTIFGVSNTVPVGN